MKADIAAVEFAADFGKEFIARQQTRNLVLVLVRHQCVCISCDRLSQERRPRCNRLFLTPDAMDEVAEVGGVTGILIGR